MPGTPACADPRIAEIAEISDPATRAKTLFDYLKDWVPPGEVEVPTLPPRQPAPLETAIVENRLVVAVPLSPPLPPGPVDDRARKGWDILKDFRADFARALNIANYRPLATAIAAFDRAMGDSYDHLNEIAVGLAGQRLAALAQDVTFTETMPEGAATELGSLGAAITTFANRFPEWLDYLNDPADAAPVAASVQDNITAFDALEKSLAAADDVDLVVLEEYRDEVELVRQSPQSETAARALLASTRDLLLTLSENALMGMRLYRDDLKDGAVHQFVAFKDVIPGEIRKKLLSGMTYVTLDIIFNKGAIVLHLSAHFPTALGWVPNLLAALGVH